MRAHRLSVNLKLGLVVFAAGIAVASLVYTNRVVDQLREREAYIVGLQARAFEELSRVQSASVNPYADVWPELAARLGEAGRLPEADRARYAEALAWAETMPAPGEVGFITEQIIRPDRFGIPAILSGMGDAPIFWRNVPVDSALVGRLTPAADARLRRLAAAMDAAHAPVPIVIDVPGADPIRQRIHYGESGLVRELRLFPYIQLLFVGLFVLAGYLGFSYVRRSEQSSLWAGMAKEAAHQLGTPISSLMGWAELMKLGALDAAGQGEAVVEIEKDIARLQRVTNRFSSIGSVPRLDVQPLAPVVDGTAAYVRRRIPRSKRVALTVDVPAGLRAALNADLFEWVIENLLKNALDAIDGPDGTIAVSAREEAGRVVVEVRDTGKGIERRDAANVFRPGFSTKKRGWGLGLSLARRIVEDYHGGRLRLAASKTGADSGTTFRIELDAR